VSIQRFTPRQSTRGTTEYVFFELALASGPQAIGVTGDNSYETLYGREYLLVWDDQDGFVKLYRETATLGEWDRITVGLPSQIFDVPLPDDVRHITFAFDQSARIIFVYEQAGLIFVTRWNPFTNAYVQNVSFAGVDPCLLMDATVADPRGFPSAADGWSVREAYYAGIRVLFEWIPDGQLRTNAIPDSDIVLFYLTPDRLQVKARVQRQLYATANDLWTFAEPVVLDRAVALSGKYQLLVSDAAGDKRNDMLVSDDYIGDFIVNPQPVNLLPSGVAPESLVASSVIYPELVTDVANATVTPSMRVEVVIYREEPVDPLDSAVVPEAVRVEAVIYPEELVDEFDSSVTPELIRVETTTIRREEQEEFDATVAPETIRVQTI
jgi:hypothetical protein